MANAIKAIYTDGACSGNPGPGGWGVVIQFADGTQHELGGYAPQSTNNRMELQASIEALKALKTLLLSPAEASLHTDSEYVKNGITKWLPNWKKRGWKTAQGKAVLNQDLWEALDELNSDRIQWHYVRAHNGHPGNERADAIARAFSLGQPLPLRQLENPMTAEPIETFQGISESSYTGDSHSLETRAQHLRDLIDILELADAIAAEGYLITSAELADLMDVHASAVTSRGDRWIWRNWEVSRVRREGNQILWRLQRADDRI
ncbi:ribonuclease HI [Altericista sp. CCNU0014]|uniref:ribonuclease HI n=1 Tax=Altericista sp. CCNU0014 TaxID=3082949 RepID=UPI00384CD8B3